MTDATQTPTARRRSRFRPKVVIPIVVILALIIGGLIWANSKAEGYYAFTPGNAPLITTNPDCKLSGGGNLRLPGGKPCARLVIAEGHAHDMKGKVFMVDVLQGTATPFEWIENKLGILNTLHPGAQLLPNRSVLGNTPQAQFSCQDAQFMTTTSQLAPVVALNHLGYKVSVEYLGARIQQVNGNTPASKAGLECNDLITAIDGHKVKDPADLSKALADTKPGDVVKVTVQRGGSNGKTTTLTKDVTLAPVPETARKAGDKDPSFIGIATYAQVRFKLPFHVSVEVGNIGGPSAGLAMTLALLDALSNGKLTGGHNIAATGTIAADGAVGSIGGVKQKTVAVERAGAQLFLVPADSGNQTNYTDAKAEANSTLKVEGVSSLAQALQDIKNFGGEIPPTTSTTTSK